jgi:hypothetical protein
MTRWRKGGDHGSSGDGMFAGWRRVGERNNHLGSGRGVYLNCGPNEMAMYVEGRRYGGTMALEWLVKLSRVDVAPKGAGLSPCAPCFACCRTLLMNLMLRRPAREKAGVTLEGSK